MKKLLQIDEQLNRVPILLLGVLLLLYSAYDYYDFLNGAESELAQKNAQFSATKNQLEISKKKLANAQEFFKNLDGIRARIRNLSLQLESTKSSLSGEVDLANFIRMISLEAKKVGLNISSIRPMPDVKREQYIEVPFALDFKGAYLQVLVFFDRLIRLQQLVRVKNMDFTPVGNTLAKYVELDGHATIVTFKYLGSSADDVQNKEWMKDNEEGLKKVLEIQKSQQSGAKK